MLKVEIYNKFHGILRAHVEAEHGTELLGRFREEFERLFNPGHEGHGAEDGQGGQGGRQGSPPRASSPALQGEVGEREDGDEHEQGP